MIQTTQPKAKPMPRPRKQLDPNNYAHLFAMRLRELRESAGLTVEEASETTGVPVSTLYGYENGKMTPQFQALPKIAKGYGLQRIGDLFPEFPGNIVIQ